MIYIVVTTNTTMTKDRACMIHHKKRRRYRNATYTTEMVGGGFVDKATEVKMFKKKNQYKY
jgi:hypothetical protein